jgi:hypothetical protein
MSLSAASEAVLAQSLSGFGRHAVPARSIGTMENLRTLIILHRRHIEYGSVSSSIKINDANGSAQFSHGKISVFVCGLFAVS